MSKKIVVALTVVESMLPALIPNTTLEDLAKNVMQSFATKFGGATMTAGEGGWVMDDGTLVTEKNYRVWTYVDPQEVDPTFIRKMKTYAAYWAYHTEQEAVMLEIGDDLEFISGGIR